MTPVTHLLALSPFFPNLDWIQICFNQQNTKEVAQGQFQAYVFSLQKAWGVSLLQSWDPEAATYGGWGDHVERP